jgi:hypothetical protein
LAEQDEKQVLLEFLKILKSEIHAARISPDEMRSVLSEIDAGEDPSEEEMQVLDCFNKLGSDAIIKALIN